MPARTGIQGLPGKTTMRIRGGASEEQSPANPPGASVNSIDTPAGRMLPRYDFTHGGRPRTQQRGCPVPRCGPPVRQSVEPRQCARGSLPRAQAREVPRAQARVARQLPRQEGRRGGARDAAAGPRRPRPRAAVSGLWFVVNHEQETTSHKPFPAAGFAQDGAAWRPIGASFREKFHGLPAARL
jgi:hypothetical protein